MQISLTLDRKPSQLNSIYFLNNTLELEALTEIVHLDLKHKRLTRLIHPVGCSTSCCDVFLFYVGQNQFQNRLKQLSVITLIALKSVNHKSLQLHHSQNISDLKNLQPSFK